MKKIAFLTNKLTLRGTEVNLYNYADANERLLGNESIIITRSLQLALKVSPIDVHPEAYKMFESRFKVFYYTSPSDIEDYIKQNNVDSIFIEKYGIRDELDIKSCKSIIHAVFDTRHPHGTHYTSISDTLNRENGTPDVPVLPNIVRVHPTTESLRSQLNIPPDAIVFGSYGGADQFNIPYIIQAVKDVSSEFSNIYFLFMNYYRFCPESKNVIFVEGTANTEFKRKFINTCDAMLYGRKQGESFGIACGEFSICNKPVIASTSVVTENKHHLATLKDCAITHKNYDELVHILTHWTPKDVTSNGYYQYTEDNVMELFKQYI